MKRPKTAWGLYLEDFKQTCSLSGGFDRFNEIQKAASAKWKKMSAAEKQV